MVVRSVRSPELEVSEQAAMRLRSAAQASTALALMDTSYLRMLGVTRSARSLPAVKLCSQATTARRSFFGLRRPLSRPVGIYEYAPRR